MLQYGAQSELRYVWCMRWEGRQALGWPRSAVAVACELLAALGACTVQLNLLVIMAAMQPNGLITLQACPEAMAPGRTC